MPFSQNDKPWYLRQVAFCENAKDKWRFIIGSWLFMTVFIIAFLPFGVDNYNPNHQRSFFFILTIASLGFSGAFPLIINEFVLRRFIPRPLNIISLSIWLCWHVLGISISTFLYYNFLGDWHDFKWNSYVEFIANMGMLTAFPIAGMIFYLRYRQLQEELQKRKQPVPSTLIRITSENGKEAFDIKTQSLLLIESEDNYAAIYYWSDGRVKKQLIRSSLKRLEDLLPQEYLFRCHRSFIINLQQVNEAHGTNRQMSVKIQHIQHSIPVSKNKSQALREMLPVHSTLMK